MADIIKVELVRKAPETMHKAVRRGKVDMVGSMLPAVGRGAIRVIPMHGTPWNLFDRTNEPGKTKGTGGQTYRRAIMRESTSLWSLGARIGGVE